MGLNAVSDLDHAIRRRRPFEAAPSDGRAGLVMNHEETVRPRVGRSRSVDPR
jgi:hypothetical protein